ncbi:phosphatidylethanolamine N-methyltransferase-like [Crassostrea virginica]|uniref:Phosphatidylethanolamine N-methyltransferase n=1 Tax=Crassostrea virginica TaxID=6565 RepID=A0A8B8BSL9_CRAVI|nr:phosphatidylethanolamine N-methyltransferase-like [Crassostrea virginica]
MGTSDESMYLKLGDVNLWISMATIMFNPLFWNVVARREYRRQTVSRLLGGPRRGCITLAVTIVGLGCFRDWWFKLACESQPEWPLLYDNGFLYLGYLCIVIGSVLVFSSYWALGFYGTFLGDYFGILMEKKVTHFPFNVIDNPMYWGSTIIFGGTALVKASLSGLLLTCLVAVCYKVAIFFEGPFTAEIYNRSNKMV